MIKLIKLKIEDYLRIENDLTSVTINSVIKRKEVLIAEDIKNMKMMKNRIKAYISTSGSESIKDHSFVKLKSKIRTVLEQKLRK